MQYLFSRSDSKLLLLSGLTGFLIIFGGVSLYIVSGEGEEEEDQSQGHGKEEGTASLGEAMWAAAAGAGGCCCNIRQAVSQVVDSVSAHKQNVCEPLEYLSKKHLRLPCTTCRERTSAAKHAPGTPRCCF